MFAHLRLLAVAAAFALATTGSVAWLDAPLARWIHAGARGSALGPACLAFTDALDALTGLAYWTYFAAALFVAAGALASLTPRLREHASGLWLVAATHLASLLVTSALKGVFGRLRPLAWFARGEPYETFFAGGSSFPSGHVTFYLGLILPVALAWPRARVLLAVPVLVGAARVGAEQHFLADTLGAVVVVLLVAWLVRALAALSLRARAPRRRSP